MERALRVVAIAVSLVSAWLACARGGWEPQPWNLVIVTLDTTRADALGAYGQPLATTPALDRLAREGVLFEQVESSSPSTLPSHATIFTGRHPYRHGARSNAGYALADENRTLAEVLGEHGYRTGAEVAAPVLGVHSGIAQGFERVRRAQSVRSARDVSSGGIEFLRESRDERFFLWLHYFDPHDPHDPPPAFADRFAESPYLGEVAYVDSEVGRVIAEIERLGLRDRTLVVVTADHGEGLGEHGETTHSYFVYEGTTHVPLILWGPPALDAGRRVASLVRTVDIAPTLLALLGLPPLADVQGVSLLPLLTGEESDLRLTAYGESLELAAVFDVMPLRFVREGRWKYVHQAEPRLHDLSADPRELENRASREPEVALRLRTRLRELLAGAPPGPKGATALVDEETRGFLIALGYATPSGASGPLDELASLEIRGVDAATKARDVDRMLRVQSLMTSGRYESALRPLAELLASNPDSPHLLALMGETLEALGRLDEAAKRLARAAELRPGNLTTFRLLARVLHSAGRVEESLQVMQAIVDVAPCDEIGLVLNGLLHARKRYAQQLQLAEAGARRCPESPIHLNNLAWVLATAPDEGLRDGPRAVELARRALAAAQDGEYAAMKPVYLDTLAAAHAEAGDFEAAVAQASGALETLAQRGAPESALAPFRERLAQLRAGRAVRDP